jgi:hypothetical protein
MCLTVADSTENVDNIARSWRVFWMWELNWDDVGDDDAGGLWTETAELIIRVLKLVLFSIKWNPLEDPRFLSAALPALQNLHAAKDREVRGHIQSSQRMKSWAKRKHGKSLDKTGWALALNAFLLRTRSYSTTETLRTGVDRERLSLIGLSDVSVVLFIISCPSQEELLEEATLFGPFDEWPTFARWRWKSAETEDWRLAKHATQWAPDAVSAR